MRLFVSLWQMLEVRELKIVNKQKIAKIQLQQKKKTQINKLSLLPLVDEMISFIERNKSYHIYNGDGLYTKVWFQFFLFPKRKFEVLL